MIEKIRLSLWDILTFFLSGFLLVGIICWHMIAEKIIPLPEFKDLILSLPVGISLFLLPVAFTLLGMLLEPVANYFDKLILDPAFKKLVGEKQKHKNREKMIEEFIKTECLGKLNGKIENPFSICKEYVETKQLSTTFMIFLSRYGFYRNASFLSLVVASLSLIVYGYEVKGILICFIALILMVVFKKRAEDFYSYQAPSIYYAFLIDKLDWKPRSDKVSELNVPKN